MSINKKIVIFGGGTVSHVRNHLALCAPAYGKTARRIAELAPGHYANMDVDLQLTKMAGGQSLETNEDIANKIDEYLKDDLTKIIIMNAALCDFNGEVKDAIDLINWDRIITGGEQITKKNPIHSGKYSERLQTNNGMHLLGLTPAEKIINKIRQTRKDIFLVGFKTTCGATEDEQYLAALNLCKKASCNLVVANDTKTRLNLIVTPEEARYHVTDDRDSVLNGMLAMAFHRTHLTFTRSTVIGGQPVPWNSTEIPNSLRTIVNFCIESHAYKPFNGVTAGHFAYKVNDNTFYTSIRKTNFNKLAETGLVKIVTDGPDTVLAYGAKPSVGGQSQRIVFNDHPGLDCIVHFHCPKKKDSEIPTVSQYEMECGSHECGNNTSKGLKDFGNGIHAVYLDNHGPNIVFNKNIDPQTVINFITENFDLSQKTGGFVSAFQTNIMRDAEKLLD